MTWEIFGLDPIVTYIASICETSQSDLHFIHTDSSVLPALNILSPIPRVATETM